MKLSRLGGSDWAKTRKKVKAATEQMAKELIELYARRKQAKGYAFPSRRRPGRGILSSASPTMRPPTS